MTIHRTPGKLWSIEETGPDCCIVSVVAQCVCRTIYNIINHFIGSLTSHKMGFQKIYNFNKLGNNKEDYSELRTAPGPTTSGVGQVC